MKTTIFDVFFNFHNEYESEAVKVKAKEFLEQYPKFKYYVSVDELTENTLNRI